MKKCLLCINNEPNKKGSHHVPHFLIASAFSSDGSNQRDKEISFRFDSNFVDLFVGRSIQPEELNEVLGRGLTEEEIELNSHHHTRNYYLCIPCENRFSILESYYSTAQKKESRNDNIITIPISGTISLLFWISVIWRWSAIENGGYRMNRKDERKLRNILNLCLGFTNQELLDNTNKHKYLMEDMHYLLFSDDDESSPSARLVIPHPKHKIPYSFLINRHVLLFYFKKRHFQGVQQNFFGYEKEINIDLSNNINSSQERIKLVSIENAKRYNKSALDFKVNGLAQEYKRNINLAIDILFSKHLQPLKPTSNFKALIFNDFMKEIVSNKYLESDKDLKYTEDRFTLILFDVLKKYIK